MEYEVRYDDLIVTQSTENVQTLRCSSISFYNKGSDAAVLNGNIPLEAGATQEFNNLPYEKIVAPFKVVFLTSVSPKVVIIRKFTKLVK